MSTPHIGQPAATKLQLPENTVDIWCSTLDLSAEVLQALESTLSADEKHRSARFYFERDRKHFIAARGILRNLLGRYLNVDAGRVEFDYGPQKKPALKMGTVPPSLHFNVSHSQGLGVFAFTSGREVGIDVEPIRAAFASEEIAENYFSPAELAEFRALPLASKAHGFFLCWTRKEAYVKAKGAGLSIPLGSFDVSLTPDQPEKLRSDDSSRWMIRSFEPQPGYVGAIVAEGSNWTMNLLRWAR